MIRKARPDDFKWIEEIGRLTWEGHDYLPMVFDRWLEDGHFFVIEVDEKVVGTAKLTILPCGVGWMEGLRVHPSYRGRGYANKLHNFLISYGEELSRKGVIDSLMYATHVRNEASKHLGYKKGFKLVKKFYHLSGEISGDVKVEEAVPLLPPIDLVPVGWRFIRKCNHALNWLKANVKAFRVNDSGFFTPKEPSSIFTPFDYSKVEEMLEGMGSVAAKLGRRLGLMIPEDLPRIAEGLRERGFSQWEGQEPDILIFELKLDH